MFRREEFPLEIGKDNEDPGSISWVLLASLKDHEEELTDGNRQAAILQSHISQLLKSNRIEKPNINDIAQLFRYVSFRSGYLKKVDVHLFVTCMKISDFN